MTAGRAPAPAASRLYAILGVPGLAIAVFSVLSLGFGLYVFGREYNRLRASGRAALRPVLSAWVRTTPVHYLGWTLADYADAWRRSPDAERPARREALRRALETLGATLDAPRQRAPLVNINSLELGPADGPPAVTWKAVPGRSSARGELMDRLNLLPERGAWPRLDLTIRYRLAPSVERMALSLEASYRRLLMALVGLSGYSLLCLGAMVLHVRALRDRVAREAAQEATLDLADRTCHELGNVAFVLTNEGRNLADHLDLVDRFLAESGPALEAAARRAGLDEAALARLRKALGREYADRGIDPEVELADGNAIARQVGAQVAVCSDYIALTVRELDAYLKQSALPVTLGPVDVEGIVGDALALLAPAIETAGASVRRSGGPARARGDRRLLMHAVVNLVKNAIEAASGAEGGPAVAVATREDGAKVWIEVGDNGPGLASTDEARAFEAGFSTKGAGRGRGLAIVRDSVESQGGEIRLERGSGGGARFSIGLPRWEGPVAS